MELTREEALSYHYQMWSDMQNDLGDDPSDDQRFIYKRKWIANNFPEYSGKIANNCFLCEYAGGNYTTCENICPVKWPAGRCEDSEDEENWDEMPISELLALPEREVEE